MKICVYGAGAIGGLLGARLAQAGEDVTLIARGNHLAAIEKNGLSLTSEGREITVRPFATDDPRKAGEQDHVILAMKATGLRAILGAVDPLLGPRTTLVSAINGIPWWYFHKASGAFEGRRLASIDPDGALWRGLDPNRAIGCVVYPAARIAAPGHIVHEYGNRFMLGEPDGEKSPRIAALSQALTKAGFKAPIRPRIRDDIWLKLWGNVSFNPVSALTGATLKTIAEDQGTHALVRTMMLEAERVASALGVKMGVDVDTRIGWARDVGEHKTSMLQDLESGRRMEIDALVAVVAELGDLVAVDTPTIDAVLALVTQQARLKKCYP
jgi:2-dehydropantoate 2-reductase